MNLSYSQVELVELVELVGVKHGANVDGVDKQTTYTTSYIECDPRTFQGVVLNTSDHEVNGTMKW